MPKIVKNSEIKENNVKLDKKTTSNKVKEEGSAVNKSKSKLKKVEDKKSLLKKANVEKDNIISKEEITPKKKVKKLKDKISSEKVVTKKESHKSVTKKGTNKTVSKKSKDKIIKKKKSIVEILTPKEKEDNLKVLKKVVNEKIVKKGDISTKNKRTKKPSDYLIEYYDLPYRYNETVVKILAQTPKRLFVYWDISDKDKQKYIEVFGEDFFEKTYPVLLVHNEEMNYTFEVPINDFANSWYLDINDSKTKYVVQLGRKFRSTDEIKIHNEIIEKENINLKNDFIYITDSNKLESPNDHILFEKMINQVTYRNVKDGVESQKDISKILNKLEKSYKDTSIKEIYKKLYGDELSDETLDISNPSSGSMPTSR